jgi:hypothetical protein
MPVNYSTVEEEHPVFHLWSNCPDGLRIEPDDLAMALADRSLCPECFKMLRRPPSVTDFVRTTS